MDRSVYRPSAPGGELLQLHCPPQPRSVIRFARDGVLISAYATYVSSDEILVKATFEVPQGETVRLLDAGVEVAIAGQMYFGRQFPGERKVFQRGASRGGDEAAPLGGPLQRDKFKTFWFAASVSAPHADVFTLKLPRFTVNGTQVDLPQITFSRHTEFYIAPMNC